jgi:acyl-CoA synthetase (AMP-forming)/AMP-acid ligase II
VNAATYVLERARARPEAVAVFEPRGRDARGEIHYAPHTNRELDLESDAIARGLQGIGIGRGVRTALMVRPSFELFAITLALFKAGAIPIMVDPGIGLRRLGACLTEAEPEAFIGIPIAHAARKLLGWGRATLHRSVTVGRRWFWGGETLAALRERGRSDTPFHVAETRGDEEAAILFTSGSTGPPKGVIYRHENFAAQVEAVRRLGNIGAGEIDLPTFPPFALFDPALGMTAVLPDMDPTRPGSVDPRRIISALEAFDATSLFGSPALLDTVGRYGAAQGVVLPTLKRVISAGAPVPTAVMERFLRMLPDDAEILTPYGATECLPVSCISSREVLAHSAARTASGAGVCVGMPVPSVDVRIIETTDEPIEQWRPELELPFGRIGEITVRGPQATHAYYKRPEETKLAKIVDPAGGFWHRMGDLGYVDEEGRLWFCGRKADRVRTEAGTLHTAACEAVFDTHPKVRRSALVGVGDAGKQEPVLCVELVVRGSRKERATIRAELLELGARHPDTKHIRTLLFHRGFPVDIRHNAKIGRGKLRLWATKKLGRRSPVTPRRP